MAEEKKKYEVPVVAQVIPREELEQEQLYAGSPST